MSRADAMRFEFRKVYSVGITDPVRLTVPLPASRLAVEEASQEDAGPIRTARPFQLNIPCS
jgi:hypothetical protein